MVQLQTTREVEITTPLGDDVLLFHRMTAQEELGRLFAFELELISKTPDIKFEEILGRSIAVRLTLADGGERYFNGFVSRFDQKGSRDEYYAYSATVRPWLWFLTRTADCRIFQAKTVPDIVKEIFRDHGFADFEEALSGTYRTWEYCVQYRETDFNFVARLMEQEGIYYYFKHEKEKHILVLSDAVSSHEAYPGYAKIPYYPPDDDLRREQDHIFDWTLSQEIQSGVYALTEYDFTRPKANLEVKAAIPRDHARAALEIFDYPGEYVESAEGETYARIRLEALQAQHEQIRGQGNARGLSVGSLFELTQYPREDQNREYLVVAATHQLESTELTSGGTDSAEHIYTCNFTALHSKEPFRPLAATPKPLVQGPQTAMVVGPSGQEIHTDTYGRVKIQFHWDRYGKRDENSSCWVRVSHPTAGKGWGAVQIPRIGQEVIVDFLEGDPDHPIITGRVYNAAQMPPYELPGSGMVSGMKSNSTPGGGGYNEMSMNDTKGEESITIHGQYDMNTTIEHDETHTVVSGNRSMAIQSGTNTEVIKGNASLTIQAGTRSVDVSGGDYTGAATGKVSLHGKGAGVIITGTPNIDITGTSKLTITSPNVDIGDNLIKIHGTKIELVTAGGSIVLDGSGVSIHGSKIQSGADGNHEITGAKVALSGGSGSVELSGAGAAMSGSKVSISGAGSTEITGSVVKIN